MFKKLSVATIQSSVQDLMQLTGDQMSSLVIEKYNVLGTETLASLRNEVLEHMAESFSYVSKELSLHFAQKSKIEAANLCIAVSLASLSTLRVNVGKERAPPLAFGGAKVSGKSEKKKATVSNVQAMREPVKILICSKLFIFFESKL